MALPLIVEIVLTALLAATLVYCALLERKLTALRKGQDGLRSIIAELNTAITNAGASMRQLKAAASDAGETLDDRLTRARSLADELSLLTASGERIAQRIETGASQSARSATGSVLPAAAGRLEAARARTARPQTNQPDKLRNVR